MLIVDKQLGECVKKLDALDAKLNALHADIRVMQERCGDCRRTIAQHDAAIDGSNGAGLKTRVGVLEAFRGSVRRAGWFVASTLVGLVLSLIGIVGTLIACWR